MHSGCKFSNDSHFCRQVRQPDLNNNNDGRNKLCESPQVLMESNLFDWQFLSLPTGQLSSQTKNHAEGMVAFVFRDSTPRKENLPLNRPYSALPFTSATCSEDSSRAFPFSTLFLDSSIRTDSPSGINSSAEPRSPIEQLTNNLASNIRQLKNWWQNRRRNSKELINRANVEDKHARSRFSLSCDEKQARKTLQQLLKNQSKKDAKVRFESQLPTMFATVRVVSSEISRPLTAELYREQQAPIKSVLNRTRAFYLQKNGTLTTDGTNMYACTSQNTKTIVFQQKLQEIKQKLLSGPNSNFENQDNHFDQPNELISSSQHFYCASKASCRRKTIPKLFQAQDAQLKQSLKNRHFQVQLQEDKHLALTKARTLSMEAKSAVCESFLATWPTSSTMVGCVDDFLPNEEELGLHMV